MLIGTKKAINSRLETLEKCLVQRKRDMLHAAEEGGQRGISAEAMRYAADQMAWAVVKIGEMKERIGKDEKDE
ncbi:MAG: hypothetical protein WC565_08840 [Parcubacteria group bacterium]